MRWCSMQACCRGVPSTALRLSAYSAYVQSGAYALKQSALLYKVCYLSTMYSRDCGWWCIVWCLGAVWAVIQQSHSVLCVRRCSPRRWRQTSETGSASASWRHRWIWRGEFSVSPAKLLRLDNKNKTQLKSVLTTFWMLIYGSGSVCRFFCISPIMLHF